MPSRPSPGSGFAALALALGAELVALLAMQPLLVGLRRAFLRPRLLLLGCHGGFLRRGGGGTRRGKQRPTGDEQTDETDLQATAKARHASLSSELPTRSVNSFCSARCGRQVSFDSEVRTRECRAPFRIRQRPRAGEPCDVVPQRSAQD